MPNYRVLMERVENMREEAMFKEIMVDKFPRLMEISVLTNTGSTIYTKQDKLKKIYIQTYCSEISTQQQKKIKKERF